MPPAGRYMEAFPDRKVSIDQRCPYARGGRLGLMGLDLCKTDASALVSDSTPLLDAAFYERLAHGIKGCFTAIPEQDLFVIIERRSESSESRERGGEIEKFLQSGGESAVREQSG